MDTDNADETPEVFPVYAGRYKRVLVLFPLFLIVFWISTQSSLSNRLPVTSQTLETTIISVGNTNVLHGKFGKPIYNHTINAKTSQKNCTDNKTLKRTIVKSLQGDNAHYDLIKDKLRHFLLNSNSVSDKKYIIYDCSVVRKGRCGGWSDRLSGIVTTLIISMITNRHFMINHDIPCKLDHYIVPNELDWRMNESRVADKKAVYHFYNSDEQIRETFRYGNLEKYFSTDVSYIRINWDYIVDFRLRKGIERRIPWLLKFNKADIERSILEFLFKPSPNIRNSVKILQSMSRNNKTVCAHIRIGKNPSLPNDRPRANENALTEIWNFLKEYDQNDYTILITTDSPSVNMKARDRLRHFVYDTHRICHIDDPICDCEGFRQMILDFYLLQDPLCNVMVIAQSGFSIKAAFLRNSSNGMYCMRRNSVLPCSRYTLYDMYPNWFRPSIDANLPEYQLLI